MKEIIIQNEMFSSNGKLVFIYDCDYKEYKKHLDKKYDCISGADNKCKGINEHFYEKNGKSQHFIWVDKTKKNKILLRYLVHELKHFTDKAMDNIGIRFSDDSDELHAHFQDWYFYEIIKQIK